MRLLPSDERSLAGIARGRARTGDAGVALLLALLFLVLFLAIAGALVMMALTEARITGAERARHAVRGIAEVALERALQELGLAADWNEVLIGARMSAFTETDRAAHARSWTGEELDPERLTADIQREADASNRWGPDGRQFRLFGYGRADALFRRSGPAGGLVDAFDVPPLAVDSVVAIWISDDPGDGDANPAADGNGQLVVRVDAFGPFRCRQTLLATAGRQGPGIELRSWRMDSATGT